MKLFVQKEFDGRDVGECLYWCSSNARVKQLIETGVLGVKAPKPPKADHEKPTAK